MVRRIRKVRVLWLLVLLLPVGGRSAWASDAESSRPLVLLVNGIVEDIKKPSQVWGQWEAGDDGTSHWTGMIGSLQRAGYRFGGQVRAGAAPLTLPRDLNADGADRKPADADLFWLQFSENAATDGIALKAMELATAIARLRELTGRTRVCSFAHSAGGLVARAYLQNAFPDTLEFRHDVDRLITIATPHLGSALAEHWGDWVGTRATSLKTTASLLNDLNDELSLPTDVRFASIVVRGIWTDTGGAGARYDRLVDHDFLDPLPIDFREGGDQVLSVRTQNLRLARCAGRYETATGQAVQYVLARVRKNPREMIHTAALADRQVQEWVRLLIEAEGGCWEGFKSSHERVCWVDRQASACAFGVVELQTERDHWCGGVAGGKLRVRGARPDGDELGYRFSGEKTWSRHFVGAWSRQTPVAGRIVITTDSFGRIRGYQADSHNETVGLPAEREVATSEF